VTLIVDQMRQRGWSSSKVRPRDLSAKWWQGKGKWKHLFFIPAWDWHANPTV